MFLRDFGPVCFCLFYCFFRCDVIVRGGGVIYCQNIIFTLSVWHNRFLSCATHSREAVRRWKWSFTQSTQHTRTTSLSINCSSSTHATLQWTEKLKWSVSCADNQTGLTGWAQMLSNQLGWFLSNHTPLPANPKFLCCKDRKWLWNFCQNLVRKDVWLMIHFRTPPSVFTICSKNSEGLHFPYPQCARGSARHGCLQWAAHMLLCLPPSLIRGVCFGSESRCLVFLWFVSSHCRSVKHPSQRNDKSPFDDICSLSFQKCQKELSLFRSVTDQNHKKN